MSKENENIKDEELETPETQESQETQTSPEMQETQESAETTEPSVEELLAKAQERIAELEDKNLRMMAEFDNYRRRTNKEKLELMATAGERIFKEMLPLVDDFERAVAVMDKTNDINAVREGIKLIQQKFISFLDKQDVHAIETEGADFNTDEHEAVTTFAAGEDKKGKVIDCTQKGYKLGEKVIRFAKVVVGE
ncbi:MAG: nucleotide exchange factor GrpE [Paludibacteraceae bacterium]|nr:nucleotide exchange factor GrpE [Paludibacteraceae bacterium]